MNIHIRLLETISTESCRPDQYAKSIAASPDLAPSFQPPVLAHHFVSMEQYSGLDDSHWSEQPAMQAKQLQG